MITLTGTQLALWLAGLYTFAAVTHYVLGYRVGFTKGLIAAAKVQEGNDVAV